MITLFNEVFLMRLAGVVIAGLNPQSPRHFA
jgi:hypothetical protein